ncbi:hypothetical protein DF047_08135 [Burkholderia cenocepacia]|nr:hypothetical protein DF047_08135 [Burkholderia cenocepacia]
MLRKDRGRMSDFAQMQSQLDALMARQAFDQTIDVTTEFLERHGASVPVLRIRSAALAATGRIAEALADIRRCLENAPDHPDYVLHCASLEIAQHRPAVALELLDRIDAADPMVDRVASAAWAQMGEFAKARDCARRACEKQPDNHDFRENYDHLVSHETQQLKIRPGVAGGDEVAAISLPYYEPKGFELARTLIGRQSRVIYALLLREIAGQYQHSRIGYLWALIEPVVHLTVLGLFFSLLTHSVAPLGKNLYLFYLTGLLPFFMITHTASKVMQGIAANRSLLLLPAIKPFDILIARALLSFLTEFFVGVIIGCLFLLIGISSIPSDPLILLEAISSAWVFGLALGIAMSILVEMFESWEMVWSQFTRVLYFCSGIFYVAEKMPPQIRDVLIWNPCLQYVEWFRSGFYDGFVPPWLAPAYVNGLSLVLLAGALALLLLGRKRIRIEE